MLRLLRTRRALLAIALAIGATLVAHTTASSASPTARAPFHVELLYSKPAANETLTVAPKQLGLWFSEPIQTKKTTIHLTDAHNQAVKLGKLSVDTSATPAATLGVSTPLGAGKYTVSWHTAAADDGHPSSGKYSFVVK